MITLHKIKPDPAIVFITVLLAFILLGEYGRQFVEWLLIKLHEFFVQRTPVLI